MPLLLYRICRWTEVVFHHVVISVRRGVIVFFRSFNVSVWRYCEQESVAIIKSAPFLYPNLKLTAEFGGLIGGKFSVMKHYLCFLFLSLVSILTISCENEKANKNYEYDI